MHPEWLRGIFPPAVTPFDKDGEIDEKAFREELRYLIKAGVHGVATTGTTAEGPALSEDEHRRVFEIAAEETKGKIRFLAGIIPDSTRQAVRMAKIAREAGADGLMVTPTHYLVPKPEGIKEYYRAIAAEAGLPVVIYNVVPQVEISAELMAELAEIPNVVAVKQSAGDIHKLIEIVQLVGDRFIVMSGIDNMMMSSLQLGAVGTICAVTSIIPELAVELYNAVMAKDYDKAVKLHYRILPVVKAAIRVPNNFPAGVKAAINLLGRNVGYPRSPLTVPSEAEIERIRKALVAAGVLNN